MTATATGADIAAEWAPCHSCGRSYPAASMATFARHPGDHLCITCLRSLGEQARPVIRIPLQCRIPAWAARLVPRAVQGSAPPVA